MTLANALFCATACQAAYSTNPLTFIESMGLTLEAQATANTDDAYWFLASCPSCHILSFRGTTDFTNWIEDGTFFQTTNPRGPGNVHQGFDKTLTDQYPAITAAVKATHTEYLVITGHSLGGAMAALCADWFDDDDNAVTPAACYTFGSPRIGDIPFANDYAPKQFRFVNSGDVVPHLPPPAILEGLSVRMYRHCGIQAFLGSTGLVLGGDLPDQFLTVQPHYIQNYITAIQLLMVVADTNAKK
jgi:hypothetical protein